MARCTRTIAGTILIASIWFLSGCVTSDVGPKIKSLPNDHELYGDVPIVRLGMDQFDVEKMLGAPTSVRKGNKRGDSAVATSTYASHGLEFDSYLGIIRAYRSTPLAGGAKFEAEKVKALKPEMTPAAVAQIIGKPRCGYSNRPDEIVLNYPDAGVQVLYKQGKVVSWH